MLRSAVCVPDVIQEQCCVKEECGDDCITACTVKTEEHETSIDTTNEGIAVQLKEEDEEQWVSEETPESSEYNEGTINRSFRRVLVVPEAGSEEKTPNSNLYRCPHSGFGDVIGY
ncbi:hypothetical protein AMELA_G00179190 [Ameiurus melas]|uniref:Uncharacterized protein n=1 Tax=Ameiurus melas TaxID=219545 RepID=A0A7J6A9S8_AMEME|nr:hypothetical protein AMELA_G00179190 [Ameiurus melas]